MMTPTGCLYLRYLEGLAPGLWAARAVRPVAWGVPSPLRWMIPRNPHAW